jgi:hypothetical protein
MTAAAAQRTFSIIDPETGKTVGDGATVCEDAIRDILRDDSARDAERLALAVRLLNALRSNQAKDAEIAGLRADSAARERQQFVDQVRAFSDAIDRLAERVDSEEQRRIQSKLDAAPDPDDPKSHGDHLQAPLPAPEDEDKERLAAMSAERPPPDAEDALADDEGGAEPRILTPSNLPAAPTHADSVAAQYGKVCRRDVKALKRQMRGGYRR